MPELRVDPLSGRRTLLAPGRAAPPGVSLRAEAIDPADDPYAPGNESQTPSELYAVRPGGGFADGPGWSVRVIPSDVPALDPSSPPPEPQPNPDLFTAIAATGAHEVIINAPASVRALADLDPAQVAEALEVWRERMLAHESAACLHLVVNEHAGLIEDATPHTHAELYALDFVPAAIARERERFGAYAVRTMGQNLQADLVQEEVRRRERIVAIDDDAVLIAPYASHAAYQLTVMPRRPRARFQDSGPTGAALLHDGLSRLARHFGSSPPLCVWVRTAPRGADHFSWRIDIHPRITPIPGLELGTGVHLNPITPERAASELRAA